MPVAGSVTSDSVQGSRSHQEDRYRVHRFTAAEGASGWLLGVMDGHNGAEAAEECWKAIPELFSLRGPEDAEGALRRLVAELDERTRGMRAGSTVCLACVLESHTRVVAATLGDSPVLILDCQGRLLVGPHHNVRTNLEERRRAEARGGAYDGIGYLVNPATGYGLQMARALGDRAMGEILSREPELLTAELGPGSVVLLASDGLLDLGGEGARGLAEELAAAWREGRLREAAALVGGWAKDRLWDNATAVIWSAQDPT